jgi:hypothetical protein
LQRVSAVDPAQADPSASGEAAADAEVDGAHTGAGATGTSGTASGAAGLPTGDLDAVDLDDTDLVDATGQVRALVLELARPADWVALARVWQGVQTDLAWPAPGIAVSGTDAYQLWISMVEPLGAAQARRVLELLCSRYLADVAAHRLTLWPQLSADAAQVVRHTRVVPAVQGPDRHWSAYVGPELAPVFADEPWLDQPPTPSAQASLLGRLASVSPVELARLPLATPDGAPAAPGAQASGESVGGTAGGTADPVTRLTAQASQVGPAAGPGTASVVSDGPHGAAPSTHAGAATQDPLRFLQGVMADPHAALALRIEAAKALLPYRDLLGSDDPQA